MSRPYKCDGPSCDAWYRTTASFRSDVATLTVIPSDARSPDDFLHFCHWDCALRYAATQSPLEKIPDRPEA